MSVRMSNIATHENEGDPVNLVEFLQPECQSLAERKNLTCQGEGKLFEGFEVLPRDDLRVPATNR
jgi:hypothetical protein